jgi:hypothetical protein
VKDAFLGFAIGAAATAAFEVMVQIRHPEQASLLPFIGGAAVVAGAVAFVVVRRFWVLSALAAAVLVPVLDQVYVIARLFLCLFTDCDLS